MTAKADLHVHSKHSNRPPEWILRQFGAPESFTEPRLVYRACRERGMDFVTISDHDSVAGALEIAHLPGTFLSEEVTVEFPEDGCEIHCLVAGIDEEQHRGIQELRRNVYELRDYLCAERIVHSVAHPLYRVNNRLTLAQLEKLLVLFNRFEALNGIHDRRGNELVRLIFGSLTPAVLADLAERHRLTPAGPTPWIKCFTGGSDDHGGFYIATTYTQTPPAATVREYLDHLLAGRHEPGGETGSSLRLTRSLYSIGHEYFRRQFPFGIGSRRDPFAELLRSLALGGSAERTRPATSEEAEEERAAGTLRRLGASLSGLWHGGRNGRSATPQGLAGDGDQGRRSASAGAASRGPALETVDRKTFAAANHASQEFFTALLGNLSRHARRGRLAEGLGEAAAQLAPLFVSLAPYLVALQTQHKDADLLEAASLRFLGRRPETVFGSRAGRKAWFTDTLAEVNGVARTIRTLTGLAQEQGRELVAITCGREAPLTGVPGHNFQPLADFPLPGYDSQRIKLPSPLEVLDHCERERYSEILISTPGPLGLLGLAAGKLLGIPVTGIYHTDFPLYVRHLAGSETLEEMTWVAMRWFFGQMDRLHVASRTYRDLLVARGFDATRLRLLPRGVDSAFFNPAKRDPRFWRRFGLDSGFKFLYVGRISREKNLDGLLGAFTELLGTGRKAQLVVVGDGPYLKELARRHRRAEVLFTGFLHGEDLARAYASSDLFVFPSTTDTFGNVVLEAQSAGLPAIVSDQGGPQEIVRPLRSGLVVNPHLPGELAAAMAALFDDPDRLAELSARAVTSARGQSWEHLLDLLWQPLSGAEGQPPVPVSLHGPAAVRAAREREAVGFAARSELAQRPELAPLAPLAPLVGVQQEELLAAVGHGG